MIRWVNDNLLGFICVCQKNVNYAVAEKYLRHYKNNELSQLFVSCKKAIYLKKLFLFLSFKLICNIKTGTRNYNLKQFQLNPRLSCTPGIAPKQSKFIQLDFSWIFNEIKLVCVRRLFFCTLHPTTLYSNSCWTQSSCSLYPRMDLKDRKKHFDERRDLLSLLCFAIWIQLFNMRRSIFA